MSDVFTNDDAMRAFADRQEDESNVMLPAAQQQVMIRPVGAQAIVVRRDPGKVMRDIRTFAAAGGDAWYYSWDVKDKNSKRKDGKTTIEGPSVKLANDVARLYGNCSVGVERVEDTGTHWVFHARFIDFESGYEYARPFQQRKSQGQGQGTQADRQTDIAFQIGASKSIRNCTVNALGTFTDFAMVEAKHAIIGKVEQKLDFYRDKTLLRLSDLGVDLARVERQRGKASKEWAAADVAQVIAQIQAVAEGMTQADELWPAGDDDKPKPDKLADFAGAATQATAPAAVEKHSTAAAPAAEKNRPEKGEGAINGTAAERGPGPRDDAPLPVSPKAQAAVDAGRYDDDGKVIEDDKLEIPAFLKRQDKPAAEKLAERAAENAKPVVPDKAPDVEHHDKREWVRAAYPGVPEAFYDGYLARQKRLDRTQVPAAIAKNAAMVRAFASGWNTRDQMLDAPEMPK